MPKDQISHSFLKFMIILLGTFLITSCGARPTMNPATTAPVTATITKLVPTVTPEAETATPASTVSPAPTTPPFTRCQEIIDAQWPKDFLTEGSIIFTGECYGKEGLYKLSSSTRKIEPFWDGASKNGYFTEFSVSPDHQWLAIGNPLYNTNDEYISTTLEVMGEDGSSKIRYAMDRNWRWINQWLDSGLIGMETKELGSKILLNLFTGSISRFSVDMKDREFWTSDAVFDPRLKYVVYLTDSRYYALMEIATKHILWQSDPETSEKVFAGSPQWSPDGAYFVLPMREDDNSLYTLTIVSRDGQKMFTSEPFTTNENWGGIVYTRWSPNGKYLSFREKTEEGQSRLAFLDTETRQRIYGDKTIILDKDATGTLPEFLQNDQKFIIEGANANYLVDLESGKTAQIDINLSPLTWVKTKHALPQQPSEPFPLPPRNGAGVKQTCLKPKENAANLHWSGALVFSNDEHLYILSPDGKKTVLANGQEAYVSPNRKWLAFVTRDDNLDPRLWLTSLGAKATEITQMGGYVAPFVQNGVQGWFSDNEWWAGTANYDVTDLFLFNPFTSQIRGLIPFQESDPPIVLYCMDHGCPPLDDYIYDQALERRVSLAALSGDFPGGRLALQSRNGDILWSHTDSFAGWNMPQWQPGDKVFGVPMVDKNDDWGEHYEIFTISRDGSQRQLTNYTAAYPTMSIAKFSWSPNGRYIAFWGDTHSKESIAPQNPYRLFVLDTVTHQTVDYCVAGDYVSQYSNHAAPVWSPDGSQIAMNGILNDKRQILLVDFAAGTVTPVAEGELVGWMAEK